MKSESSGSVRPLSALAPLLGAPGCGLHMRRRFGPTISVLPRCLLPFASEVGMSKAGGLSASEYQWFGEKGWAALALDN